MPDERPSLEHWFRFKQMREANPDAAERGRLMTAHGMANDPDGRKRMEDTFGIEFCKVNYPECYRSGWGKLLDKVRAVTPW